ncbi:hypothetical protein [Salinarchaeum sp. Harcht-Bsk1]|nr:hypothetical protein [Salinarchaeum sp. Harcht-Bsk1]
MSSRIVEPDPCWWCGSTEGVQRLGPRWLCGDCRDEHRTAQEGPL